MKRKRERLRLEDPPRREVVRLHLDRDQAAPDFSQVVSEFRSRHLISLRRKHRIALDKARYYQGRADHFVSLLADYGHKPTDMGSRKSKAEALGIKPPTKGSIKAAGEEFTEAIRNLGSAIPYKRRRASRALVDMFKPMGKPMEDS